MNIHKLIQQLNFDVNNKGVQGNLTHPHIWFCNIILCHNIVMFILLNYIVSYCIHYVIILSCFVPILHYYWYYFTVVYLYCLILSHVIPNSFYILQFMLWQLCFGNLSNYSILFSDKSCFYHLIHSLYCVSNITRKHPVSHTPLLCCTLGDIKRQTLHSIGKINKGI
jgi:hypothetical protein